MGTSKILIVLLLVGLSAGSPAADNPYQAIVARNVFGLKDPPPPPNPEDNKPPPPKILLQGLASVLGKKQVLFEIETPPRPPQVAGRTSMILGVGESQNEVEVLEIVEATGTATATVKFNNHGTIETKTFEKDSAKPIAAGLPIPGQMPAPGGTTIIAPRPTIPPPGLQTIPTRTPKNPAATDSPIPPPPPGTL